MSLPLQQRYGNSDWLEQLKGIRTLPVVAMKVNDLINDPHSSGSAIAEMLKKDQALTAKILKLVNSSYYAIPGGVADVQRALAFLGFNTVAQLVLSISVFSVFTDGEHGQDEDFSMPQFWRHSLATAVCSESMAKRLKLPRPEEAFTCGLLHDIGKLVLHELDRATFLKIFRVAKNEERSFSDAEIGFEVPSHDIIGEAIAAKWGLPQNIRLAIRYHHVDVTNESAVPASVKPLIQVVRLANALCVRGRIGKSGDFSDGGIAADLLTPLKLAFSDLTKIEEQLEADMDKAGAFLNVTG